VHCQYGLGMPVIELDLIIVKSKSLKILWIGFFWFRLYFNSSKAQEWGEKL